MGTPTIELGCAQNPLLGVKYSKRVLSAEGRPGPERDRDLGGAFV